MKITIELDEEELERAERIALDFSLSIEELLLKALKEHNQDHEDAMEAMDYDYKHRAKCGFGLRAGRRE